MEKQLNLYDLIIKSVESQIAENNPPVTRETYNRLISNGNDEITAKQKIASLMAEEIYYMMKDDRIISEKFFAERLSQLL
jgi:hypothetical protein